MERFGIWTRSKLASMKKGEKSSFFSEGVS